MFPLKDQNAIKVDIALQKHPQEVPLLIEQPQEWFLEFNLWFTLIGFKSGR